MILAKAPLRVSFFGGGSDVPTFFMRYTGATLSSAIDKYVYVAIMPTLHNHIKITYSDSEIVTSIYDVKNELIRETLLHFNITSNIEITTFADIPTIGTGLSGSSAFVCALIRAIEKFKGLSFTQYEVAELACHIEINRCKRNIGKQDQYACAFGGFNLIEYGFNNKIKVTNLDHKNFLERYCILVPTLVDRKAAHEVLDTVDFKINSKTIAKMRDMAIKLSKETPDLSLYGAALNAAWELKKTTSTEISSSEIDSLYTECINAGSIGSKLLGAGGGGYILSVTEDKQSFISAFPNRICLEVKTVEKGAELVYYD